MDSSESNKSNAFGIDFYLEKKNTLINEIIEAPTQPFEYIVTPNINHIVNLAHRTELTESYRHAKYRLCDSRVLFPFLKRLNVGIKEVIPGSTLTNELLKEANKKRLVITIVGAEKWQIKVIEKKLPNLIIKHYNPPMGFSDSQIEIDKIVNFVGNAQSHLVFFAVGCPRQEQLALNIYQRGNSIGIGICVGASIDFISGKVKRAPIYVQNMRLEWLYRILQEPKRLVKRYISDFYNFIPILYKEFKQ